jgi:acid phosphatase (class A)
LGFFNNVVAKPIVDKPYLDINNIKATTIDSPTLPNSKESQEEINEIIKIQKKLEPQEIDSALEEKEMKPEIITEYIDKNLSRNNVPKLYALLDKVGATSYFATHNIKNNYKIIRPYLANKNVQAIISPSNGYSYPSGHATGSYLWASVLSLLMPQQAIDFQNRAQEIAWHRVQVGMHYPQDLKGGKQLSLILLGGLLHNQDFLKDFNAALAELQKNNLIK